MLLEHRRAGDGNKIGKAFTALSSRANPLLTIGRTKKINESVLHQISILARLCSSGSSIAGLLAFRDHFQSRDTLKMFSIVCDKRHPVGNRRRCDPGVSGGQWMPFDRPNLRPLPA